MKNYLYLLLAFIFSFGFSNYCFPQGVAVNGTGATPDSSAIFDASSTTKGALIPRMDSTHRKAIISAAQGLLVFDSTINCLEIYRGNVWQPLSCACTSAPATPGTITTSTAGCSATYSIAAVSGANSYAWSVPSGATITSGQGTNSVVVNLGTATGNVSVTANNNCGTSSPGTLSVSSNNSLPGAAGPITGYDSVCISQTGVNYQVATVSGATSYTWTVPPGATITNTGVVTNSINVNYASNATSGSVGVIAYNSCGSSSATLPVTVNTAIPSTPGTISGPGSPAQNTSGLAYMITAVPATLLYTWTTTGLTLTSGQKTTSIIAAHGTAGGSVCVTASNGCGTSNSSCLTVDSIAFNADSSGAYGTTQRWVVPSGLASVNITAYGAQGGNGYGGSSGGAGAEIGGTFSVTAGHVFKMIVGQQGVNNTSYSGGGGGGGSFMWDSTSSSLPSFPMVAAAGGGGGSNGGPAGGKGSDTTTTTTDPTGTSAVGGSNGSGGSAGGGYYSGGGGGGWTGNGSGSGVSGGYSVSNGAAGGPGAFSGVVSSGGYGGGGGNNLPTGGGGGGYNGGGGGYSSYGGGGGGSYIGTVTNKIHIAGGNPNLNGQITITW